MANYQNIEKHKYTSDQDHDTVVENGRKGGIASGEAKREKKRLKAILTEVLDGEVRTKDGQTMTHGEIIVRNTLRRAAEKGSVGDLKTIMELTGEYTQRMDLGEMPPVVVLRPSELEAIDKLKK